MEPPSSRKASRKNDSMKCGCRRRASARSMSSLILWTWDSRRVDRQRRAAVDPWWTALRHDGAAVGGQRLHNLGIGALISLLGAFLTVLLLRPSAQLTAAEASSGS